MENWPDEQMTASDDESVAVAFRRLQPNLLLFATGVLKNRDSASEAVQNAFVKLMEQEVSPEELKPWLYKVTLNEALEIRRRRKTEQRVLAQHVQIRSHEETGETQRDDVERLRLTIAEMDVELRRILELRLKEELKFVEIAERLNLPLGTVLTRMRKALKLLKQKLLTERDD